MIGKADKVGEESLIPGLIESIKARHKAAYEGVCSVHGTDDTYAVKGRKLTVFHALAYGDIRDLLEKIERLKEEAEMRERLWFIRSRDMGDGHLNELRRADEENLGDVLLEMLMDTSIYEIVIHSVFDG